MQLPSTNRTATAALQSAHREHSAHAVTKYQGNSHCLSSISPQNAFQVCTDQVQEGQPLPLFNQPTERIPRMQGQGTRGSVRMAITALPSAHRTHSKHVVTRYKEDHSELPLPNSGHTVDAFLSVVVTQPPSTAVL